MKNLQFLLVTLLFLSFIWLQAKEPVKKNLEADYHKIELNLLEGVNSDNTGLKISSAYFLGELKSEKAVIPLMKMLRSEKCEGARVMAALSLVKIGSERSLFMLKRESEFNDFERVRQMCGQFYKAQKFNESVERLNQKLQYASLF
ncbi:MAG: HEAT repeat domain-containing protein [Melioribacteraceae bacterium]|nr:HEAT repeat domain-containing protein [Melioribacteraceae bacterium]MDD3557660.1 HEAT repeat domain-containing protein [Melioribacteraceae bacterium]